MSNFNWFEEKPSRQNKERIEHSADLEFDRRSRLRKEPRRQFFGMFASSALAGITAVFGLWFAAKKESSLVANSDELELRESFELMAEAVDLELISDIELIDTLEILEYLEDEELNS